MSSTEVVHGRAVGRRLTLIGVVGAALYCVLGTWSKGTGYGGVDADGGWIDANGMPSTIAPPTVDVRGHAALWVLVLLVAILVGGNRWTRGAPDAQAARRRYRITAGIAIALVVLAASAYTALAMWFVDQAFAAHSLHPVLIGNADLTISRMTRG